MKVTFIEYCITGKLSLDDIDDFIDIWHNSDTNINLHEFLGMTVEEYSNWVHNPDILSSIIESKKMEN